MFSPYGNLGLNSLKNIIETSIYSWENLGVDFQSDSHQMCMAILNLRITLKTEMKIESPMKTTQH
jgi:hypothetical protein